MKFGDLEIFSVSGGQFRLDGGAMFGVVPKPLWQQKSPADELNRIQLDTNCLVIKSGSQVFVCDTGFGSKLSEKEQSHIASSSELDSQEPVLLRNLRSIGIAPEAVTHVLFSHLHFDHAGGATRFDANQNLELSFPNALHLFQKREMEDAVGDVPELFGSYYSPELKFVREHANCQTVVDSIQLTDAIQLISTGGHTAGHQLIEITSGDQHGIYFGDICPTSAHLNVFWTMAYDAFQLDVRRAKFRFLAEMAERKTWLFFDHDPQIQAATIQPKNSRSYRIDQTISLRN